MSKKEITATTQIQDYEKSLSAVLKKIESSKHQAITTVNKLLIDLYWFIGQTIVALQEKGKWGESVVEKLSQDLRMKHPDMNGLSSRNLWDCKRFYETYHSSLKLRALLAEISWTHNLALLNKTKNIEEKEFYLKMSLKERWSSRELYRQIDSAYFERYMLSKDPAKLVKIEQEKLGVPANLKGKTPKRKMSFPFSEKIGRAQIRKARNFFSFWCCRAKRGSGGTIRAYDLVSSHHALRA